MAFSDCQWDFANPDLFHGRRIKVRGLHNVGFQFRASRADSPSRQLHAVPVPLCSPLHARAGIRLRRMTASHSCPLRGPQYAPPDDGAEFSDRCLYRCLRVATRQVRLSTQNACVRDFLPGSQDEPPHRQRLISGLFNQFRVEASNVHSTCVPPASVTAGMWLHRPLWILGTTVVEGCVVNTRANVGREGFLIN